MINRLSRQKYFYSLDNFSIWTNQCHLSGLY